MRLSPSARRDLEAIEAYLQERVGIVRAARLIIDFTRKLRALDGVASGGGLPHPELNVGVRSWPIGRYIVYYRQVGRRVDILRIRHGSRNPQTLPEISFLRGHIEAGLAA